MIKFLKYLFYFFSSLLLTLGCSGSDRNPVWTIMVYMAGDNNLSNDLLIDLEEIKMGGGSELINVIVQIDTMGSTTKRLSIKDGQASTPEDIGEQNMADPATLEEFVKWAHSRFPARRYALILSSHGNGLAKKRPHKKEINLPKILQPKILQDDTDGISCCLSNTLVREALEDSNVFFDLLGFDASQMGQIETAYEFRDIADILVFSQETGQANGWDYTAILKSLKDNPFAEGDELADIIVSSYRSFYEDIYYPKYPEVEQYLTISAVKLKHGLRNGIDTLAVDINELSTLLRQCLYSEETGVRDQMLNIISDVIGDTQELNQLTVPHVYLDFFDLIMKLNKNLNTQPSLPLPLKEIEVKTASMLTSRNEIILSEYHGKARPEANGLSILFFRLPEAALYPMFDELFKQFDPYTGEGKQVQFFRDTLWDDFLLTYYLKAGMLQ